VCVCVPLSCVRVRVPMPSLCVGHFVLCVVLCANCAHCCVLVFLRMHIFMCIVYVHYVLCIVCMCACIVYCVLSVCIRVCV